MNKIGIFDSGTSNHYTYLYTICKVFQFQGYHITVFCSKSMYSTISKMISKLTNIDFYLFDSNIPSNVFIKKMKCILNNLDMFWINTYRNDIRFGYNLIKHKPSILTVLTIHNINTWFNVKVYHLFKDVSFKRGIIRLFSYYIRRNILRKVDAINVLEIGLKQYILSNFQYKKDIFTIPFTIFEDQNSGRVLNDKISIIIPGMVTNKRRHYDHIISIFERNGFKNIRLTLLGKLDKSEPELKKKIVDAKLKGSDIVFYENFIDEKTYTTLMQKADIILADLIQEFNNNGVVEIYGKSKSTGVIFNMIRYAVPGILPSWYQLDCNLNSSTLIYDDFIDLESILIDINDSKISIMDLRQNALINSKKFTIENISRIGK